MSTLSENLKRVLEGLAYQDAAEYLSTSQKLEVLGVEAPRRPSNTLGVANRYSGTGGKNRRRIALISGAGSETPALDFALGACQRHTAELDLVSLGVSPAGGDALQKLDLAARQAGTHVCQVHLAKGGPDALRDYVGSHPSLIYLVATVADDLACELTGRILRTAGVGVPLVLVGDPAPPKPTSLYAA